jgi:hypothetical protein
MSSGQLLSKHRYLITCLVLVGLGGAIAARIAVQSRFNTHPDERGHVEAFCFFETHAWLPPLNLDELDYGIFGWHRVYSGEVVYLLYGRLSALVIPLVPNWIEPAPAASFASGGHYFYVPLALSQQANTCHQHYIMFRLFNVLLFVVTLAIVFTVGARHQIAAAVGIVLLTVPQVTYLYSYANSDAWGLSMSVFLGVFALTQTDPLSSRREAILLALLTAGVLLAKEPFWVTLVFAYGLLGWRLIARRRAEDRLPARALAANGAAFLLGLGLLLAPYRIVYPLSQGGNLAAQIEQIREERAEPSRRPSTPTAPGYRLRARGIPFNQILFNIHWHGTSYMSFYGLFGWMAVPSPRVAYVVAFSVASLNGVLTTVTLKRRWPATPSTLRLALLLSLLTAGLILGASLYHSWSYDYQPQGRYLFAALVPIAVWMAGTLPLDSARVRALRLASAALALALSFYVLWYMVIQDPLASFWRMAP